MVTLRALASELNVSRAIRKVLLNCLSHVKFRKLLTRWRQFALRSTCDEILFSGLCLAPVCRLE